MCRNSPPGPPPRGMRWVWHRAGGAWVLDARLPRGRSGAGEWRQMRAWLAVWLVSGWLFIALCLLGWLGG